jgi:hypothetical protein
MTYINLTRHDARLGGNLRLRLAKYLQNVDIWMGLIIQQIDTATHQLLFITLQANYQ